MSEHTEQCAVIEWFDIQFPHLTGKLFAVPNGGNRSIQYAMKMKREGLRSGVPDLWLPVMTIKYHGLVIEMKDIKKGKVSDNQKEWIEFLCWNGFKAMVCHGFDEAKKEIEDYLTE